MCAAAAVFAVEPAGTVSMRRDTPVDLRLEESVSSASARPGDRVVFTVAEDVRVGGSRVVVRRGSAAWGRINSATPRSRMARDGRLEIQLEAVCLADGSQVPLRGSPESAASGSRQSGGSDDALFLIPAFPVMLFIAGRDVELQRGHEITAWTARDVEVDLSRAAGTGPVTKCEVALTSDAESRAPLPANAPSVVVVRSDPAGADIFVDGKFAGQTPSTLRLAPGDRNISIKMDGRAPWQRTLVVTPGGEANVAATLQSLAPAAPAEPWLWPLPPASPKSTAQKASK